MKLLRCNGTYLEVRNAGPALLRLEAREGGPPIKLNGWWLLEDDAARDAVREVMATGLYDKVALEGV